MAYNFHFDPVDLPPECEELRQEVREFLRSEIEAGTFSPHGGRTPFSSRSLRPQGRRKGWIGMTWPKQYGGHERTFLERYVVIEEMLAHRAPTRAYSTADRQSGPMILRYGQQQIKETDPAPHRLGRTLLLHRPVGTQFRLRRIRRLDPRHQDRGRLAGQRPQDLDQQRA